MNPVRLYLVISLFYFFVFQIASNNFIKQQKSNVRNLSEEVNLENLAEVDDSTRAKLENALEAGLIDDTNRSIDKKTVEELLDQLDDASKHKILQVLDSAELVTFNHAGLGTDSMKAYPEQTLPMNDKDETATSSSSGSLTEPDDDSAAEKEIVNWSLIEKYKDDDGITDRMLFDSLSTGSNSEFKNYLWRQYIRVRRSDEQLLTNYVVNNLPFMMLFLLPVFALILKLLYVRSKMLYIKHLIHALHLHSFAYMLYALAILLIIYGSDSEEFTNWVILFTFVLVSTYAYISFLRVYRQGKTKTLVKFNLVGFIYVHCLLFFFLAELFLSFLLY